MPLWPKASVGRWRTQKAGNFPFSSAPFRTPAKTNPAYKTKDRTTPWPQCQTILPCHQYKSLLLPATCPRPSFFGFSPSLNRLTKGHRAGICATVDTACAGSAAASAVATTYISDAAAAAVLSACAAGAAAAALPPTLPTPLPVPLLPALPPSQGEEPAQAFSGL